MQVQGLLHNVSLDTFGDTHVAYIEPGRDPGETILVLTLEVDDFFSRNSFLELERVSSAGNFTLAGLLATPVWYGGPALRAYSKQLNNTIHVCALETMYYVYRYIHTNTCKSSLYRYSCALPSVSALCLVLLCDCRPVQLPHPVVLFGI